MCKYEYQQVLDSEALSVTFTAAGAAWARGRTLSKIKSRTPRGCWGQQLERLGISASAAGRDLRLHAEFISAVDCAKASGDGSVAGACAAMRYMQATLRGVYQEQLEHLAAGLPGSAVDMDPGAGAEPQSLAAA